jgi:hypothetical protein
MEIPTPQSRRLKRAELTSGIGALILGIGIGVLLFRYISPYSIPVLLTGLFMHAWGMFDKRRLEHETEQKSLWWTETLYWLCWILLIMLGVSLLIFPFTN